MTGADRKLLRLEALVASPPTSTCEEIISMLEKVASERPDMVRIDIYYAGSQPSVTPTSGYQNDPSGKRREIPSVYVNGACVASGEAPDGAALREAVEREIANGKETWQ